MLGIITNIGIFILTVISTVYAIRLAVYLNHTNILGWWTVLPIVMTYAMVIRLLILLDDLNLVVAPLDITVCLMVPFWAGTTIFMYGLYTTVVKVP